MEYSVVQWAWVVPVLPLLVFLFLTAIGERRTRGGIYASVVVAWIAVVCAAIVAVFQLRANSSYTWEEWSWLRMGEWTLTFGFEVTNLNVLMLAMVTCVSALVLTYSLGYMKDDARQTTFFAYVCLFTFAMNGLVLSSHLLQLYIFWEIMGFCSFLLIGFWYTKSAAKRAAKKAFIVTRIGDVALFIAIVWLFWEMPRGSLSFNDIHNALIEGQLDATATTGIAILIFIGAMGKSGQFPLHTWLPDAMEGPTPISALIHAATMVAAGVFLVVRTYDFFLASEIALDIVAYVGAFTACMAAFIALKQDDIKRILAYSTVSQLGTMMLALGMGTRAALVASVFHLLTHAFFKALLFLGAGNVIHATHTQSLAQLGGLMRTLKLTALTFGIGALALAGVFPFAGFWSKEAIFYVLWEASPPLFWVSLLTAGLTALYMTRLFVRVFLGAPRIKHVHTLSRVMTWPLVVLAGVVVCMGWVYTPWSNWLPLQLGYVAMPHESNIVVLLSTTVVLASIFLGWGLYRPKAEATRAQATNIVHPPSKKGFRKQKRLAKMQPVVHQGQPATSKKTGFLTNVLIRAFYIDELYDIVVVKPFQRIAQALVWVDQVCIRGVMDGIGRWLLVIGRGGTSLQNGQVQRYGVMVVWGFLLLISVVVVRRFW